ncbi:hypothetical protein BDQ17DRAFT_1435646 [Cyathus striatus]|nr:hypothetical protein BDQ17DRAFT_1435646 [Cyathus striatus]
MAIPIPAKLSPNMGPSFGSTGFLQFFISDVNWGVEVTQEDERMPEYARWVIEREGGDGSVTGPFQQWAIIEFRRKSRKKFELKPNYWYVLYDDRCKRVTIKYGTRVNLHVNLREDKENSNRRRRSSSKLRLGSKT